MAIHLLIYSSAEEGPWGLLTTKPRSTMYSSNFILASPFFFLWQSLQALDCSSHSIPGLLLSAGSLLLPPTDNNIVPFYFKSPTSDVRNMMARGVLLKSPLEVTTN